MKKLTSFFVCLAVAGIMCTLALTVKHEGINPEQLLGAWTQIGQYDDIYVEMHWSFYGNKFQWSIYTALDSSRAEFVLLQQGTWTINQDTLSLKYEDGETAWYQISLADTTIHMKAEDEIQRTLYRKR